MRKVSDLYNIEERTPLIIYVLKGSFETEVLHIARRQGYYDRGNSTGVPELVTNCNRVLEYSTVFTGQLIPDERIHDTKLCAHCGQRADFERALLEQQAYAAEVRRKYLVEQEARRAELDRAWELTLDAMEKIAHLLTSELPVKLEGIETLKVQFNRKEGTFIIQLDDVSLELVQTNRKVENASRTNTHKEKAKVHAAAPA